MGVLARGYLVQHGVHNNNTPDGTWYITGPHGVREPPCLFVPLPLNLQFRLSSFDIKLVPVLNNPATQPEAEQ